MNRYDLAEYARYYAQSMERLIAGKRVEANWSPDQTGVLDLLAAADIAGCELIPTGSNYTYLLTLRHPDAGEGFAVYKPRNGEAPLWDFAPGTLFLREAAAFELSRLLGWDIVPPTVVREGPGGAGAVQLFIDADLTQNYFTLRDPGHDDAIRRIALFDCLANNADRKGGHFLLGRDGRLWGIDHGLTFHPHWKLRTVVWDYCDEPFAPGLLGDLARLRDRLRDAPDDFAALFACLDETERRAFEGRLSELIARPCYPPPGPHRSVPWPPV